MKWTHFAAAALIISLVVLWAGAPLFSVLAGSAGAAVVNWRRRQTAAG
jgi:hypothetical protein